MTTTRRLPGGEVVILWEAQVSPLGLHSKRWLAHHNEFLPETKPKLVSKVPKSQATCNVVLRRPNRDTPHGLGYRGWCPWYSVTSHFSMGFPSPQQPMLSMFSSTVSPNHSTLYLNIDRHGYWRGWKNEGARAQNQPARL